jgi:hypothetical protein
MSLIFVRVGACLMPKNTLTGHGTERVDTRVLRVRFVGVTPGQFRTPSRIA